MRFKILLIVFFLQTHRLVKAVTLDVIVSIFAKFLELMSSINVDMRLSQKVLRDVRSLLPGENFIETE